MKVLFFLFLSFICFTAECSQKLYVMDFKKAFILVYGEERSQKIFNLLPQEATVRIKHNPHFDGYDVFNIKECILNKDETERMQLLGFCALQKDTSGRDSGYPESGTTTPVPSKFDLEGYLKHVNFQTLTPSKVNPNF